MFKSERIIFLMLMVFLVFSASITSFGADEIIIGAVGPLSPPGSVAAGEELKTSMELAVNEINERGGVLGRQLKLVFEDSRGTPEQGVAAVEKLISREEAVIITGEAHSSAAKAEMEVAHRYGIPFLISECWSDELTEIGYPEVFRIAPNNKSFSEKVREFIVGNGFKRIASIVEDTDFGIGNKDLIEKEVKELGLDYNFMIVDRTSMDFVPQLIQLKAFKPDLFVHFVTGPGSYLLVKQSYEVGLSPSIDTAMFMAGMDATFPEYWPTVGAAGQFVVYQSPYHNKAKFTDLTEPFVKKYTETYNRTPSYVALEGYDSILIIAEVIEKIGGTEPDKIIQTLEEGSFKGTRGIMEFPSDKSLGVWYHNAQSPMLFLQYTEVNQPVEESEIVYPKDVATTEMIFPTK